MHKTFGRVSWPREIWFIWMLPKISEVSCGLKKKKTYICFMTSFVMLIARPSLCHHEAYPTVPDSSSRVGSFGVGLNSTLVRISKPLKTTWDFVGRSRRCHSNLLIWLNDVECQFQVSKDAKDFAPRRGNAPPRYWTRCSRGSKQWHGETKHCWISQKKHQTQSRPWTT